jgi:XTP/dITP diphosphohydrolase
MISICFATNNTHKIEEVQLVLGVRFSLTSLADVNCREELPETTNTIEGNALQKAEYVLTHYQTPCFADDSGLEVDALQGAPGVDSAHYAGPQRSHKDNVQLLLNNLKGNTHRQARFRTVIALAGLTSEPVLFHGSVSGTIITEPRGKEGFGYDPVFVPDGFTKTFAEMTMAEKNQLSHRAIAVKKLAEFLKNYQR